MNLYLATLNQETWQQYASFFAARKLPLPPAARQCIFVQDEDEVLVGGAMVFPTDGPHLFIEHLAVHPELTAPEVHEVVTFMCEIAKGAGAVQAKYPFILAAPGGLGDVLDRAGFNQLDLEVWNVYPGQVPQNEGPLDDEFDEEADAHTQEVEDAPPPTPKVRKRKSPVKAQAAVKAKRSPKRKKAATKTKAPANKGRRKRAAAVFED